MTEAALAAAPVRAAAPPLALLDDPLELRGFTSFSADAAGRQVAESSLALGGLHCGSCAGLIEQALRGVPGVLSASVNGAAQRATVRWDAGRTRASDLVAAVQRAGYTAAPDTAAGARAQRQAERRSATWRLFVAAFCSMQIMMMAAPAYFAGPGELAPDLKQLLDWASWLLTLPVLWFSALPFFSGAWRALRQGRIGMDLPVSIGVAVAFVASSGAAFQPGGVFGHEVYFDSIAMFISFLLGGRWLEMAARHRAAESLETTLGQLPASVLRAMVSRDAAAVAARPPPSVAAVFASIVLSSTSEMPSRRAPPPCAVATLPVMRTCDSPTKSGFAAPPMLASAAPGLLSLVVLAIIAA